LPTPPGTRDGRWKLPHTLAVRTAWCDVLLDLTSPGGQAFMKAFGVMKG
jgi:hypothetical protein